MKYIVFTENEIAQSREQVESYDLGQAITGFPIGIYNDQTITFQWIDGHHTTIQALEEHLIEYFQTKISKLRYLK